MRSYRCCLLVAFLVGALFSLGTPQSVDAQERDNTFPRVSPNATVSQTIGVTEVQIAYSRPSVRGRTIFGELVPFGEPWRTGANEATTFSVSTPVKIQGERLDAGTYAFFTIPGPDSWTLIFNEEADQWGAFGYDSNQDALRVNVEPESGESQEQMIFTFEDVTDTSGRVVLHWSDTRVPFEITVNTPEIVRAQAEEAIPNADSWQTPARYASYALEQDMMIEDALEWIDQSIEQSEEFGNLALKARLLAANGQYSTAVETANSALQLASSMDDAPNGVEELRSQVEEWKGQM